MKKKGYQLGEKDGYQLGEQKGRLGEILKGIELGLELKFGVDGLKALPDISKIKDIDVLYAVLAGIRHVKTIDELQQIYRKVES